MELMLSCGILVIISGLSFVAYRSSWESIQLNKCMTDLQYDARNAMRDLALELEQAVKRPPVGELLPEGAVELTMDAAYQKLTYCVPTNLKKTAFNSRTITFSTEDKPATESGGEYGNTLLDSGEDKNGDGRLNRQLTVTANGATRVLGAATNLANVRFALSEDGSVVTVTMTATTRWRSSGKDRLLRYDTSSQIYLMN